MTLHYGFDTLPAELRTVVSVGSFDGVHVGHRVLLGRLVDMAARLEAESVVVTFDPHPRIAMGRAEGMHLLTTVEERALLLGREGIDHVVVAHFDDRFRSQSYEEFVRQSLIAKLGMVGMVVGYNHRFGRGNEGTFESLRPLGDSLGFCVERVEQHLDRGDKVSSTVLRDLLERGDVERAEQIMGHKYIIMGQAKDGRLQIKDNYKLIPSAGSYRALVDGVLRDIHVRGREIIAKGVVNKDIVIEL